MTDTPNKSPLIVRTFMTHDMKDADIAALSTGRDPEFDRIMGAISRSRKASPGALQHVVLYGSRGFGKSFMTRRVQMEVAKLGKKGGSLAYLLLPEEQHNLQRSPHAFLDMIALQLNGLGSDRDEAYEAALFQWPRPGEEAKRWDEAAARLEAALDAVLPKGKGLAIVVVENFDILLASLFREEGAEQRLRLWLDRNKNRLMLFATATGTVDIDYDRPLFKAFETVRLTPWTPDDCIAYFNRQRIHDGKLALDADQEAKARAIANFIGGTPRLAQLLAEVLDTQDALTVAETMSALADKLAEYYRRRIEDLPPLGRGLLDALIRGGEPASQTELATRVGADGQNSIARAMADLQCADIIRGRPAPDSRESLYSVTDRVFVHYYRMRQGSRAVQATPLATILDFLKSFYSRDEQRAQALMHLDAGRVAEAGLFSRLALGDEQSGYDIYALDFSSALVDYVDAAPGALDMDTSELMAMLETEPERAYEFCTQMRSTTPSAQLLGSIIRTQALHRMGLDDRARAELEAANAMARGTGTAAVHAILELGAFRAQVLKDNKGAAELCMDLQNLDSENLPLAVRSERARLVAWGLAVLDRHDDALVSGNIAVELAKRSGRMDRLAMSLRQCACSLSELLRFEEALGIADQGVDIARENGWRKLEAELLSWTADLLCELQRYEQAWVRASESMAVALDFGDVHRVGWAALAGLRAAAFVPHTSALSHFDAWLVAWRATDADSTQPDPCDYIHFLFEAAGRSRAFSELDALLEKEREWLIRNTKHAYVYATGGEVFARIEREEGRTAAYQAAAGLLPRIAAFMKALPLAARDETWLSDMVSGFAATCRDVGLLRDVASLLSDDLAPQAGETATVLRRLANVLEASDPEVALARVDPDQAMLIRRWLDLPDPVPVPPKRKSKRRRKQPG